MQAKNKLPRHECVKASFPATCLRIWYLLLRFQTYAQIAQMVEQRTENPRVAGSIPALSIFYCFSFYILFNSSFCLFVTAADTAP